MAARVFPGQMGSPAAMCLHQLTADGLHLGDDAMEVAVRANNLACTSPLLLGALLAWACLSHDVAMQRMVPVRWYEQLSYTVSICPQGNMLEALSACSPKFKYIPDVCPQRPGPPGPPPPPRAANPLLSSPPRLPAQANSQDAASSSGSSIPVQLLLHCLTPPPSLGFRRTVVAAFCLSALTVFALPGCSMDRTDWSCGTKHTVGCIRWAS